MKNSNKINNVYAVDEREIQNNDKALAGAAVVSILCNVALMIIGLVKDNMVMGGIGMLQLCLMGFAVAIIKGRKDSINLPRTFSGKTISTEMTAKGRLNRIGYWVFTDNYTAGMNRRMSWHIFNGFSHIEKLSESHIGIIHIFNFGNFFNHIGNGHFIGHKLCN